MSPDGDFPHPDEESVEGEDGDGLDADGAHVAGVEGFEQGAGGAVPGGEAGGEEFWVECGDGVSQHDNEPKKSRENAVELEVFPDLALAFEVEVEGLVVGTVAQVVADVALAEKVEGGGEEQRQDNTDSFVYRAAGMEQSVFGLVEHGVGGVHDEGVGCAEEEEPRPGDGGGRVEDGEHAGNLERGDAEICFGGDGEFFLVVHGLVAWEDQVVSRREAEAQRGENSGKASAMRWSSGKRRKPAKVRRRTWEL